MDGSTHIGWRFNRNGRQYGITGCNRNPPDIFSRTVITKIFGKSGCCADINQITDRHIFKKSIDNLFRTCWQIILIGQSKSRNRDNDLCIFIADNGNCGVRQILINKSHGIAVIDRRNGDGGCLLRKLESI